MNLKKRRLVRLAEMEEAYLLKQEHGSDEYNESLQRVIELEKQIAEPSRLDRLVNLGIKVVEVGAGIIIPVASLIYITTSEKDVVYTGEAKRFFGGVFPKKRN